MLGVVGHRDPIAEVMPLLEANFRRQLEQLVRELPHTPLLMLNGLAEGIDTMAARVFTGWWRLIGSAGGQTPLSTS